jgi:hypothetical protein
MVGYCSIDDAYGGLPRETVKEPPAPEKVADRIFPTDRVEFYEVEGVMDSELGYMVVLFMAGIATLVIRDIIRSLS